MTVDEVQDALVLWLMALTGSTVIAARQGIERPNLPYLMVNFTSVDELHENSQRTEYTENAGEISAAPHIEVEWVFMVFGYGSGQSAPLNRVKHAVHLRQMHEGLTPALTIHETGSVQSIPEYIDNAWEERFEMNLTVRGVTSEAFEIDTIETTEPYDIQRT